MRSPDAPPLTPEEIAMIKASMAARDVDRSTLPSQDHTEMGHVRRFVKKNKIFSIAIAVLAVFAIILVVLLCIRGAETVVENQKNTADYTFYIGDKVYTVSEGKIGEVTQKLYDILTGIQWGKTDDPYGWVVKL